MRFCIRMYAKMHNKSKIRFFLNIFNFSYQIQLLQQTSPNHKRDRQIFVFRAVIANNALAKELFQKTSIIDGFSSYKCCDVKQHAKSLIELIDFMLQEVHSSTKLVQVKIDLIFQIPILKDFYYKCRSPSSAIRISKKSRSSNGKHICEQFSVACKNQPTSHGNALSSAHQVQCFRYVTFPNKQIHADFKHWANSQVSNLYHFLSLIGRV
ncbi:unnamed protein product [Gongylonema pulchrum]|uniref:Uncharacterized protein n=1 Tax=Gongylonema pulchrum TaxID=637853 RepID=A0A183CX38_9BILA|nr:unnamed protein product [Gongylonema pulchrum]